MKQKEVEGEDDAIFRGKQDQYEADRVVSNLSHEEIEVVTTEEYSSSKGVQD